MNHVPTYQESIDQLNKIYDKEEQLKQELAVLMIKMEQVQHDKELMQTFIMHYNNTQARKEEVKQWAKSKGL